MCYISHSTNQRFYNHHQIYRISWTYKKLNKSESQTICKVWATLNKWYDFGLGKGGNIIALAAELYHTEDVTCLLKRIEERTPYIRPASFSFGKQQSDNRTYRVLRVGELSSPALIAYLQERGIDTSRDVSPRRTSPISDSKKSHEPSVIFSRASWIISRSWPSE